MQGLLKFKNELIVIAVFLAAFIAAKGRWAEFKARGAAADVLSQDVDRGAALLSQWTSVETKYKEANAKLPFSEASEFKGFVDAAARQAGIKISYQGPSRDSGEFYETAVMNLKLTASYKDLVNFINTIEAGGKVMVDKLSIKNPERRESEIKDKSQRMIEMVLRTYVAVSGKEKS